ncbi:MAG: tetratricopeptide repeat protein [Victivallaceae bacterium]|jgi:TPR repeat protein
MITKCLSCGKIFDVELSWKGQTATCDSCGKDFTVKKYIECPQCSQLTPEDEEKCKSCNASIRLKRPAQFKSFLGLMRFWKGIAAGVVFVWAILFMFNAGMDVYKTYGSKQYNTPKVKWDEVWKSGELNTNYEINTGRQLENASDKDNAVLDWIQQVGVRSENNGFWGDGLFHWRAKRIAGKKLQENILERLKGLAEGRNVTRDPSNCGYFKFNKGETLNRKKDVMNNSFELAFSIASQIADKDESVTLSPETVAEIKNQKVNGTGISLYEMNAVFAKFIDNLSKKARSKALSSFSPPPLVESVADSHKNDEPEDAEAQYNLGVRYQNGDGVDKDMTKAVVWYRKAAEQGNAEAQNNLGWSYANGLGVAKDETEAVNWYRKAAEQNNTRAQCNLGACFAKGTGIAQNEAEAVKCFRKAAEQGDAGAQYNLGLFYYKGRGMTQDMTKAVEWYRKAAEQGNAFAQYNLGHCYRTGEGIVKDNAEAVKWFSKAAEQGLPEAQFNLAMCYGRGEGVAKDGTQGIKWLRKAAEQGQAEAQKALKALGK